VHVGSHLTARPPSRPPTHQRSAQAAEYHLRLAYLMTLVGGIAFTLSSVMDARTPPSGPDKTGWDLVDEQAGVAEDDNEDSIRALTDAILNFSVLTKSPGSIRDRLYRAERGFRRSVHPPVLEADVVAAANDLVAALHAPDFARTSPTQVRAFRNSLANRYPHLVGTKREGDDLSSLMSPAETLFVTVALYNQKIFNPAFQVSPEEWEQALAERLANPTVAAADRPRRGQQTVHVLEPHLATFHRTLSQGVADEAGNVVRRVHAFLDRAGFQR
jgi:hypothetical protein